MQPPCNQGLLWALAESSQDSPSSETYSNPALGQISTPDQTGFQIPEVPPAGCSDNSFSIRAIKELGGVPGPSLILPTDWLASVSRKAPIHRCLAIKGLALYLDFLKYTVVSQRYPHPHTQNFIQQRGVKAVDAVKVANQLTSK